MEGNRVYVASCPGYDRVEDTLRTMLARMGGMERFVKPGERILLKVNLLRPASPETAVCTHPAVVAAVAKLVKEAGGQPVIADSPGGTALKESGLRHLYEKTGMAEAAARSGAELNYDTSTRLVSIPRGKAIRQAEVIAPAAEADGVLDLCKMKTHVLMGMTGAVKNSFGIIPGLSKVGFHGSHPRREDFADVVLDLTGFLAPRLSIMDGVLAMEGEGPGASGTPTQRSTVAAENPLALDVAAAEIMGLPRDSNPLLPAAQRRGFTPAGRRTWPSSAAAGRSCASPTTGSPPTCGGICWSFWAPWPARPNACARLCSPRPPRSAPAAVWAAASVKDPVPARPSPWRGARPKSIPTPASAATAATSSVPGRRWS